MQLFRGRKNKTFGRYKRQFRRPRGIMHSLATTARTTTNSICRMFYLSRRTTLVHLFWSHVPESLSNRRAKSFCYQLKNEVGWKTLRSVTYAKHWKTMSVRAPGHLNTIILRLGITYNLFEPRRSVFAAIDHSTLTRQEAIVLRQISSIHFLELTKILNSNNISSS